MKKRYRSLLAIFAGILLLGLGAGQGLAANATKNNQSLPKDGLHRDGSAFVKDSKMIQSDRQAAADRAKAKGFKIQKRSDIAKSDKSTPAAKGVKQ